jgi:ketosteroid isomerase-like protein
MDPVERLVATEEIKRLKARYVRLCDGKQWDEWAEVFTEDCEFRQPNLGTIIGRAEIVARVSATMCRSTVYHDVGLPDIEILDDSTARAVWPVTSQGHRQDGNGYHISHSRGEYSEEYRKDADGQWRIRSIHVTPFRRNLQTIWQASPVADYA